jgi:hypothetical protein
MLIVLELGLLAWSLARPASPGSVLVSMARSWAEKRY